LHFGNGLYVAAGTDGTDAVIQTSPDGITWTTRSIDSAGSWGTAGSFRVGIYAFGSHVIFGQSVNGKAQYFQTSPDGITWTNHDVEDMSILRFECCATDGRRLLTGGTGGRLFASLRAA
jgi:hypothetical protein